VFHFQRGQLLFATTVWLLMLLLIGVPLVSLVHQAGVQRELFSGTAVESWYAAKLGRVVVDCPRRYAAEFGYTAGIAGGAATGAVTIGAALAWFGRIGGWRRLPLALAIGVGLAAPGPLVGLAVVAAFNAVDSPLVAAMYDRTLVAPTLAQLLRILPISSLVLWFAFASIPRNILDAAAIEGAGPWTQFWRIAVPLRQRALAGAWLAAFAVAVGELAATKNVLPPGVQTITAELFGLLHYGADDQVAGICLTLAAAVATASALVAGTPLGRRFWAGRRTGQPLRLKE
jgi:iron(III) transport system permease protein